MERENVRKGGSDGRNPPVLASCEAPGCVVVLGIAITQGRVRWRRPKRSGAA